MQILGPHESAINLKIFARGEDTPVMDLPLVQVGRFAWVVLDAAVLAGRELDRLVVTGKHIGLARATKAVSLAPPY